jgi:hypothetical protein
MTTISLLLPTRNRPALARRFLDSVWDQAADRTRVEVVMCIDEDDTASHSISHPHLALVKVIAPRQSMGALNSTCLARSSGDVVVLSNDDIIVRTAGWDEKIRALHASVPDGVYLAYPNDLFKGRRLCTFPVLSKATCRLLGDPFPAEYQGAFIDYHLLDIFKRLERRMAATRILYMADVIFEHMHYRVKKANFDVTYRARGRFLDDPVFLRLRDERSRAAAQLLAAIEGSGNVAPHAGVSSDMRRAHWLSSLLSASLADGELPLDWRFFLFYWFLGRRVAAALE